MNCPHSQKEERIAAAREALRSIKPFEGIDQDTWNAILHPENYYESKIDTLEKDINVYRGALGYPVPGETKSITSTGIRPFCGMCDASRKESTRLQEENERLTKVCQNIWTAGVCAGKLKDELALALTTDQVTKGEAVATREEKLRATRAAAWDDYVAAIAASWDDYQAALAEANEEKI